LVSCLPGIIMNRPAVASARFERFVKHIQNEKKYIKIGALGYCFGGRIVTPLAATDLFSSVVIAHPSSLSVDDIKKIKIPTSWICAEEDPLFKIRKDAEDAFASRQDGLAYEFKDYKGTVHGFGARPNMGIPTIKVAFWNPLSRSPPGSARRFKLWVWSGCVLFGS